MRPATISLRRFLNMPIETQLAELERRHRALEAEIAEARAHPSIDDLQIVELKPPQVAGEGGDRTPPELIADTNFY
jgi:hypothetical protein